MGGEIYYPFGVWAVFVIVQLFEGTVLTPKIMGDKVGLSPVVVIFALWSDQIFKVSSACSSPCPRPRRSRSSSARPWTRTSTRSFFRRGPSGLQ